MQKFLVIQTAFTGDVVLATALIEKLHTDFPSAQIDFLLRKGNEGLLHNHPFITNLLVWDKTQGKLRNLLKMGMRVRREKYTHVINIHRFASSGLITWMSGAPYRAGFDKNPLSFCYTRKVKHEISADYMEEPVHEVDRNQSLIQDITDTHPAMPCLYPTPADRQAIAQYTAQPYICIAPSSVWFTKQFPAEKWVALLNDLPEQYTVYLLGGRGDTPLCEGIKNATRNKNMQNLCGKLPFLQSAAIMQSAVMNYANDSAPLHFASAMDAPVTAVFCSTIPSFGFGPLRENARIVQLEERLYCRPCGLHGRKVCPQGHFKCALDITNTQLLWWTSKTT